MHYCDMLLRRAVQFGALEGREGFEMSRGLFRAALELIKSDGWQKYGEIRGKIMNVLKQTVKRMGALKDRMGDSLGSEGGDLWRLDLMQYYVHLYEWQRKEEAAHWARIDFVNEQKKFEKKFEPKRKVQETDTVTKRQRTEMGDPEDDTAEGANKEVDEEMETTGNNWRENLLEEKAGDEGEEDWEEEKDEKMGKEDVWNKSLTREVFPRVREIFDSDEEEGESGREEKGADRVGGDDHRLTKQMAQRRKILSDSEEEEMEIRMSEGKKDEGGVKKEVEEDEDQIETEANIFKLKAETDVSEKKQRLKDLERDWDEEETKTKLETKVKIDHDINDAEDTRGAVTLGPWRFQLVPEEEEWGNLRLPTTRKEVEMTSAAGGQSSGRRSLRRLKRRGSTTTPGPGSGIRASHQ